jgi:pyruvate dehydrogenase E2 component (dihydrolipoamide acetyltransferase)
MPQLGMTMEEGFVVEWTIDDGEPFDEGDVIAIVESEKTTNDIEAREDGVLLDRFVKLEEAVGPGDPIAYVGQEGEEVPSDIEVETEAEDAKETAESSAADGASSDTDVEAAAAPATGTEDVKISPRARTHAREHDIEEERLAELAGSGPDGAVVEADVAAATDELTGAAASTEPEIATAESEPTVGASPSVDGRGVYETRGESGLRRTIANRMTESAKAPQVTLNQRVRVNALLNIKDRLESDRELDLSVTDFLLAAVTRALEKHPEFNGVYEDGTHKLAKHMNIGIAIDKEDGLITPVIKGAGQRTIAELRAERQRLVSLAQSGEYTMEDLSDGTFTITNLGHFSVESFDPILNPPEVAILGVNTIQSRYDPDTDETVQELGLSLTFDHRAIDGADGARFLETLDDMLTHPLRLITFGRSQESNEPFLETGEGPEGDRIATAESDGSMQAAVQSRRFEWRADEPEEQGGDDTAPSPVEQFVGSLSSCLTLMIGHMAERREVELDEVNVTAQASPPEGRIDHIDVDVRVVSSASRDDVESVIEMAERACYVNQAIDDDIHREIDITVESA